MRKITFLLTLFLAITTSAQQRQQQYGSNQRHLYEKEKNGPHGECRVQWQRVRDGIDYNAIRCLGDTDDLDVHVIRVDLDEMEVNADIDRGSSARNVAREHDAPFVLNANFFDKNRRPEGVVVSSGRVLQGPRTSSWQSIFLITKDRKPRIILPKSWSSYRSRAWMAVQAGPRLVVDGHTNRVSQSYTALRAGVCIRKDGDLVFFATPRKFDMYEIARIARRGDEDGGLECRDAMLFDGGHSVQVVLEGHKRLDIRGDPVPVFVYAKPR